MRLGRRGALVKEGYRLLMTDNEDLQKHEPDEPVSVLQPHKGVFIVGGLFLGALVVLIIFLVIAMNVV